MRERHQTYRKFILDNDQWYFILEYAKQKNCSPSESMRMLISIMQNAIAKRERENGRED